MKDFLKALKFYQKTLAIQQQTLRANHPDLLTTYSNIASVYNNMENGTIASEFHQKALTIQEESSPTYYQTWLLPIVVLL